MPENDSCQETAVDALVAITTVLNPSVSMHAQSTGLLAGRVARALGLDAPTVLRTEMASRLHDIGMNGISPRILDNEDPLTEHEYNIIRLHAERGATMLLATSSLQDLAPIVRSHHERIDGKGYPDGLCADEIRIESRIIAVADAFHIMTTPQHWETLVSPFAAVQELLRSSDTQFDRDVVNALISVLGRNSARLSETA
jgi:HD-GYP domain-containing protein (c-di-GMP phosphodiesterase class II)